MQSIRLCFFFKESGNHRDLHSFPPRRSSDLGGIGLVHRPIVPPWSSSSRQVVGTARATSVAVSGPPAPASAARSEEHTSELQSRQYLVCRLLLEKKKKKIFNSRVRYDATPDF